MIDQNIIDKILEATNIVDVVKDYISLNKRGVNYWGVCPWHQDSSPSLSVSPSKGICKCFACGGGGNITSFLMKVENISFPEAIRILGKRCGVDVPERAMSTEELQFAKEKESVINALSKANTFYQDSLVKTPEAIDFLKNRGFDESKKTVLDTFFAGYAPNGNVLHKHFANKYQKETLLKSGLIGQSEDFNVYDYFRDRITFPFLDIKGNVIGFTGRALSATAKAKYLNTGDTITFKKGNVLFGLFQAKDEISRRNNAYLVEGNIDVIAMHAAGYNNTVCSSGTALTESQVKQLLRLTDTITIMFDGDAAGIKATMSAIEVILKCGGSPRIISLPDNEDPDSFCQKMDPDNLKLFLLNNSKDFVTYMESRYNLDDLSERDACTQLFVNLTSLLSNEVRKQSAITKISKTLNIEIGTFKTMLSQQGKEVKIEELIGGFHGIDELDYFDSDDTIFLTSDFDYFQTRLGVVPVIYFNKKGEVSIQDVQSLRHKSQSLCFVLSNELNITAKNDNEVDILRLIHKEGISLNVLYSYTESESDDDFNEPSKDMQVGFVDYYVNIHKALIARVPEKEKAFYIDKCAEVISFAQDTVRTVMEKSWYSALGLNSRQYKDILRPFLEKRRTKSALSIQRADVSEEFYAYDPDNLPAYIENDEEHMRNYRRFGFYPLLNKAGESVSYMFKNDKGGGHVQVGDFFMIPLLHIHDPDPECNKRVLQVNRLYSKQPLFLEVKSSALLNMQSFENLLINEEALNFENGEQKHFKRIRHWMSYNYTKCVELKTFGQQDEGFFAFSNAIFHRVDEEYKVEYVNDLGVTTHDKINYYSPSFSKIYSSARKDSDKYEQYRHFIYKDIPAAKQCSFERWAELMDKVYTINQNGKWALLYAIMGAFRSDIHSIDRLFTAIFFVGPTMSGKTQVAISIRSLYISPEAPSFNLNSGTDAAFFSLMEGFRDVPVVLEEYNNKDISDAKFQGLKSITYDGDGKQKRKGTTGKDIETSKVYSPVVLLGQETPQRDDNALMNRVVICEVPKRESYSDEEVKLYQELKGYEKTGLSNILFEVLKLRKVVQASFKEHYRDIAKKLTKELKASGNQSGDMVRIINVVSLFLTTCKILESESSLKLPFSYAEFYQIARKKVIAQVEMISRTDKLSGFFQAVEIMINSGSVKEGRDFAIETKSAITIKTSGSETKEMTFAYPKKILYLRLAQIHPLYAKSSMMTEDATLSTIEQNIRSNPAYLGAIKARRFSWNTVAEVPEGELKNGSVSMEMKRVVKKQNANSSCLALDYEVFKSYFDIDLERDQEDEQEF